MKIVLLNGSPKGEDSITLQYAMYLQKMFPSIQWKIFHVSKKIKQLVKENTLFEEIINEIDTADGVLWSTGVYVLAVPSQLMQFIELIENRGVQGIFKGKFSAVLTTSIHFYDHTAHNYLRAISEDLGMNYVDGISLYLNEFTKKDSRKQLLIFLQNFINTISQKQLKSKLFFPLNFNDFTYEPESCHEKFDNKDQKIVVLTLKHDNHTNLGKMITRFKDSFLHEIRILEIDEIQIKGGCLGCMQCGYDYNCTYNDEFKDFYNNQVRPADIIIFAAEVKGRYLSWKWKRFYDRAFFWNHTPSLSDRQIGFLVSGPISQDHNLIQILEASSTARQDANHTEIISDECANSHSLDSLISNFARNLLFFSKNKYVKPQNFLGVGGQKIFRDDIWGSLRMIWQADHKFYRKHGKYDFPQKKVLLRFMSNIMLLLTKIPSFRKKFYAKIKKMPAKRLEKMVDKSVNKDKKDFSIIS